MHIGKGRLFFPDVCRLPCRSDRLHRHPFLLFLLIQFRFQAIQIQHNLMDIIPAFHILLLGLLQLGILHDTGNFFVHPQDLLIFHRLFCQTFFLFQSETLLLSACLPFLAFPRLLFSLDTKFFLPSGTCFPSLVRAFPSSLCTILGILLEKCSATFQIFNQRAFRQNNETDHTDHQKYQCGTHHIQQVEKHICQRAGYDSAAHMVFTAI